MTDDNDINAPPEVPDKPSIAVLAFENMSGDPEQEYFSDGITEDIITELSKISGLFVIARHSSFIYKKMPVTVKQVGKELGVRYVLEGSVRRAGSRLRITAQLIDSSTDHHLWVERYDRDLEDVFAVQDEVARKIAEELQVTLTPAESRRLARTPTENMEAYDVYLRTRNRAYPPTQNNIRLALTAYDRIIQIDPAFAGGHAGKSMMHSMLRLFGHSDNHEADAETALEYAKTAIELDPEFPRSHAALGFAYSSLGRHAEAVATVRRAVELQPGDAESHYWYSRCLREAGFAEEACSEAEIAVRLDPQYFDGPYLNNLARATFLAGRYRETCAAYERNAIQGGPDYIGQWVVHAAAYGLAGETAKARQLVKKITRERPDLTLEKIAEVRRSVTAPELNKLREGLKLAGLPD